MTALDPGYLNAGLMKPRRGFTLVAGKEKLGMGGPKKIPKKIQKKCLTSFFRSGIGLKNSNSLVFLFHNSIRKEVKTLGGRVVVNSVSG